MSPACAMAHIPSTPQRPQPAASPSAQPSISTTPPATGIPGFRALRSLLPFGPGRNPSGSASTSPTSTTVVNASGSSSPPPAKNSFMTFTAVRKSMSSERKNSLSYSRPSMDSHSSVSASTDAMPVISIYVQSLSSAEDDGGTNVKGASTTAIPTKIANVGDRESHGKPEVESTARVGKPGTSSPSLPHELSTIIEADTSGLSKHIPGADLSRLNESSCVPRTDVDPEFSLPTPPDSDQHNISLLLLALPSAQDEHPTDGLDDSLLDLSPSKVEIEVQEILSAKGYNATPTRLELDGADQSGFLVSDPVKGGNTNLKRPNPPLPPLPLPHLILHLRLLHHGRHHTVDRARRLESPLCGMRRTTHPANPHASGPPSCLPRLTSLTNFDSTTTSPTHPSIPEPASGPASLGSTAANRLLSQARASLDDVSRFEASVALGASIERHRPSLLRSRKRSMSLEAQRISPGSAAPFPPAVAQHIGPRSHYTRPASSMSSSARPVMDWLGPRTSKVFAAAGLMDSNNDASTMRSPSRIGLSRIGSERNARVQQIQQQQQHRASSGLAQSEASGSNSSWGRSGTVSHTVGTSETGGGHVYVHTDTPTLSTARTNFSGSPSMAPTSVSTFSTSAHQQLHSTIQTMKERHDVKTEALLAELSNSQQASRVLRLENNELRGRIQRLEDQLEEARMLALSCQTTHANLLYPPSRSLDSRSRTNSTGDERLPLSSSLNSSNNNTFVRSHGRYESMSRIHAPTTAYNVTLSKAQKRISTTSSIFPVLPSNMAMLMAEEPGATLSSRSVSPPATHSAAIRINGPGGSRHGRQRLMSSAGNVSPMTANFSTTEMTGSPGSLCLCPEHEMHLGDMITMDPG